MSLGLRLYKRLCDVANGLEVQRDEYPVGSQPWILLTDLLGQFDEAIDALVEGPALEED